MHARAPIDLPDSGSRRGRVVCQLCGRSIENARLRDHLRTDHRLDTASVEAQFLASRMDVRRTRRSRS